MMPRGYDYIVGDVTISLARLIEKAHSKQILIGDFKDTSEMRIQRLIRLN